MTICLKCPGGQTTAFPGTSNKTMCQSKCLLKYESCSSNITSLVYLSRETEVGIYTEDPRYNDGVYYQRFCCKIEFAVVQKLDRTHPKRQ